MMDTGSYSNSGKDCNVKKSGPDLVIYATEPNMRELISHLGKIGIDNDKQWNDKVAFAKRGDYFIILNTTSRLATVFIEPNFVYSTSITVTYNKKNLNEVMKLVKKHVKCAENYIIDEPILSVGGHAITIVSKNMTKIAGFEFPKEFWIAAKVVSEHVKAKIKVGCSHQYDLDLTTINKTIELMSRSKKKWFNK